MKTIRNYPEHIKNAQWLSDSQKVRLLAVYETVKIKNLIDQAIDFLNFDQPGFKCKSPLEYKNMVVELMTKLKKKDQDWAIPLWNLYLFFDTLDCDDFNTICEISTAMNYRDDFGNYEPAINKLYQDTLNETNDKLRLLETL